MKKVSKTSNRVIFSEFNVRYLCLQLQLKLKLENDNSN